MAVEKKYKTLFNNTLIFALGSFGSKLISFFLVPLYTNILSVEEYGIADLITTCANMIVPVMGIVFQDALLRFGLEKGTDTSVVIKNSMIVLFGGILLTLCFVPLFSLYQPVSGWTWYLYALTVSTMINNIAFTTTKVKEKNLLYAIFSILQTLIIACVNIVLLIVLKWKIEGYLVANILGVLIPSVILLFITGAVKDAFTAKTDTKLLKAMVKFSLPLVLNNISWWILSSSDRIMIEYFCGESKLGLYTAASKIPSLLYVVTSIFSQAWSISSIKESEEKDGKDFCSKVFSLFTVIMFLGMTCVVIILKPFMSIYVGNDFFESWTLVPLLLIGTVYFSYGSFFGSIYGVLKKNVAVTITTLIAALCNITVNFVLMPKIGVVAASISTAISYFIVGIIRMLHSRRYYSFDINFPLFIINSIIVIALAVLVYFEINIYLVGISALVLLIIINFKQIKEIIVTVFQKIFKKEKKV